MSLRALATALVVSLLAVFSMPPAEAATTRGAKSGALVLEEWFAGRTTARGSFFNSIDGTRRDLTVDLRGRWNAKTETLTLVEDFFYADGERDRKTWRFTRTGPGTYVGSREDVVGKAKVFTDAAGNVRLQYRAKVGGRVLSFDDTLALRADGTVLNTATVSYLFLSVGRVELVFNRGGRVAAR